MKQNGIKDSQESSSNNAPSPIPSSSIGENDDYVEYDDDEKGYDKQDKSSIVMPQNFMDDGSNSSLDDLDVQGISLLGEIFPDASREELEELHFQRVESMSILKNSDDCSSDNYDHENNRDICFEGDEYLMTLNNLANDKEVISSRVTTKDAIDHQQQHHHNKQDPTKSLLSPSLSSSLSSSPWSSPLTSPLGKRMLRKSSNPNNAKYYNLKNCLADDFLRIPHQKEQHNIIKDNNDTNASTTTNQEHQRFNEYETHHQLQSTISQLERNVISSIFGTNNKFLQSSHHNYFIKTVTLSRDLYVGLGLQLRAWKGGIYVNALICHDGEIISTMEMYHNAVASTLSNASSSNASRSNLDKRFGPAFQAGIRPGDRLLGVNGNAFLNNDNNNNVQSSNEGDKEEQQNIFSPSSSPNLSYAVKMIAEAPDPIVLHIMSRREESKEGIFAESQSLQSQNSIINSQTKDDVLDSPYIFPQPKTFPKFVHPLAFCLSKNGVIKASEEMNVSETLAEYTNRALVWGSNSYMKKLFVEKERNEKKDTYPGNRVNRSLENELKNFSFDLSVVRQALCVSIVNAFVDGDRLAFTIWVYDVESQKDWYAPLRYFQGTL